MVRLAVFWFSLVLYFKLRFDAGIINRSIARQYTGCKGKSQVVNELLTNGFIVIPVYQHWVAGLCIH